MATKRDKHLGDELVVEPLTPDRLPDLARLFDQGGDPKWCWCAWYRARSIDFRTATAADNRRLMESSARAVMEHGRAPGLIAYRSGEPIGWVSVGPREDYERLEHSRVLGRVDERPVWSIVCFVVARRSRGEGVATALLSAAIDYARDHGATLLEAYPVDTSDARVPAATAFKGTLGMFERAGFTVVDRRRASNARADRPIVRRAIRRRLS
ncbi:MAG: GNAT family N-acetyltransferase [Chloroflexi bacterium]|nr:GNAT family N-acetyltransferase [Chloroflexota bacterium]